jgi:crossover junction endodeoxyribonuclease RuvC
MAKILGVDPGLTRCGFGLIDGKQAIEFGVFQTDSKSDPASRVGEISLRLEALIDTHAPELIALERVFAQANLRSVMGVAQISGALMATAHRRGVAVEFFTPSEVKAAVTGNGRATKDQVGLMVKALLALEEVPKPADVADALAVALCAQKRSSKASTPAQRKWVAASKATKRELG